MYNKFKQHSDHKKWKLFEQFTFIWSINIQLSTDIISGRKSKREIGKDKTLGAPSSLPGCTVLWWTLPGCTGLYWAALGPSGLYWAVVGCIGLYWAVVCCTVRYCALVGFTGLLWTVLGCSGLYCAVLGCIKWDDFILNISYQTRVRSLATLVTIWLTDWPTDRLTAV